MAKTIKEINEKIHEGEAVVCTAEEIIGFIKDKGVKKAAQEVDVYVNGTLARDNFAFRTATPFIDLPAGVTLNIGIAPGNSTSVNDTLKNFQVVLQQKLKE